MKLGLIALVFFCSCSWKSPQQIEAKRTLASVPQDQCDQLVEQLVGGRLQSVQGFDRPIYLVTDTNMQMSNGVVTVVKKMSEELDKMGIPYRFVDPSEAYGIKINHPMAQGSGLYYMSPEKLTRMIKKDRPFAIHLVTEGSIGAGVRKYALQNNIPFSTFYHTAWALYFKDMFGLPVSLGEAYVARFHKKADTVMAATQTMINQLKQMGVSEDKLKIRSHGVDIERFIPRTDEQIMPEVHQIFSNHPKPHSLFVGRVGVEKNIQAFLDADVKGTKFIVGDGPLLPKFLDEQKKGKHQNVVFLGRKGGEELAHIYNKADVFVLPSVTETFGLVQLEALASGTPVAAFPVQGPIDVITDEVGSMNDDLAVAIEQALTKDRSKARAYAEQFSWHQTALQFLQHIHEIPQDTIDQARHGKILSKLIPYAVGTGAGYIVLQYFYVDRGDQDE